MKPTPTETPCPPLSELRRLLQPGLPEAEAATLREHLLTCLSCRQAWQNFQTETAAGQTPPVLLPAGDTSPGQPVPLAASSAIAWSSQIILEDPGDQRQPAQPAPATEKTRTFPFLSPPRGAGELGWLAHYRITGVLGEGGMGCVFDAFDTSLHRRVALKVLKPELATNPSFRERFLLEARAAAALPDDYIVTIYQVDVQNDAPFLAMKFLYGESLEQRLQREGRLPALEILRIGREMALGLSAAHERGLIHRDIKPANLWLETPAPEQGGANRPRMSFEQLYRVKILDFGLARPVNDSRRLTATGLIVGTPQYLAPEQARGQTLDHRCDLFSLGIVLYRMATGILPFDGADTLAQLTALAVAQPRPVEELASDVPLGLRQLIHQLLERDPAKRPQTARAVAETLRALEKSEKPTARVVEHGGLKAEGNKDLSPPTLLSPRSNRRRWLLESGLLGLLLLSCGFLLWRSQRPSGADNAAVGPSTDPIKIGILFSLRGTMASGGKGARDAALLAIDELNKQGGLLGRNIVPVVRDGASDYRKFAEEAAKMITEDRVCAIFGTRASVNRKAVKEVVQRHHHLLFYPMQFEGLEQSPNIIYLGAAPYQQMVPAIDYMHDQLHKRRFFLVGSDYVFPHAANAVLRDYVTGNKKYRDAQILDEQYIPFGSMDVKEKVREILGKKPDLIVSTINGDSNTAFFRELHKKLHKAGLSADNMPVMSFSLGENDLLSIGEEATGHYAAWSYFQSIPGPTNSEFVEKFKKKFVDWSGVVSDPMETVYFGVQLWARAVQAAGSPEPRDVLESIIKGRQPLEAPEGSVRIDGSTRYTWRPMRIGRIKADGQFETVYNTDGALPPQPFPPTRTVAEWDKFLNDLYTAWGKSWISQGNK